MSNKQRDQDCSLAEEAEDALKELCGIRVRLHRMAYRAEILEHALEQIASKTGSDDPCRRLVDIARAALRRSFSCDMPE